LRRWRFGVSLQPSWAHLGLAAGLALTAIFAGRSDQNLRRVETQIPSAYSEADLLDSGLHHQPLILDLESPWQLSRPAHRRASTRRRASIRQHRRFQPEFLSLPSMPVHVVQMARPPAVALNYDVSPAAWLPCSIPDLPPFRRRNPLVRFFAALAVPFRAAFAATHSTDGIVSTSRL
jgi:hypothetical protein